MHSAQRPPRVTLWIAVLGCLAVVTACGDDDSSGAATDRGVELTTPTDDGNADDGDSGTGGGECSLVDIEQVEELFGMDLELDVAEGFAGSALCNFNDTAEDTYSVLISRIEIEAQARYEEGVVGLTDAVSVDVGDEAMARSSDGDFGGSVDLHARQDDVYVTVSTTFGPETTAEAALSACTELAGLVF